MQKGFTDFRCTLCKLTTYRCYFGVREVRKVEQGVTDYDGYETNEKSIVDESEPGFYV